MAPILLLTTILSYGGITMETASVEKINSLNPALLSSFFLFFYVKIELTISTVIASGSKSRAISRKQLFAYEWQVLIESIKNGIFQSNSPRSILNLMIAA